MHVRHSVLAASTLSLLASACGGAVSNDANEESSAVVASDHSPAALTKNDFTVALDRASIRATNPELSDADFAIKWTAALQDAFHFVRAFPPAYHSDLAQVTAARVPGGEGMCLGDAHPENFGWMTESGETFFAANDFDDSGYCPVAFDAARLFVGISLDFSDDSLTNDAIAQYVTTVFHPKQATSVPSKLSPSWKNVQSSDLAKTTLGDAFVLSNATSLSAIDGPTNAAITTWFGSEPRLAGFTLLDIAAYAHTAGGSAELARYWLLLEQGGTQTIVEVKLETKPAVEWGRHIKTLADATRFTQLTDAFWPACDTSDTFGLTLTDPSVAGFYMVRDRLQRESIDFSSMSKKQRTDVLFAEASELAAVHSGSSGVGTTNAWAGVSQGEMTSWLTGTVPVLAKRWQDAWKAAKKN